MVYDENFYENALSLGKTPNEPSYAYWQAEEVSAQPSQSHSAEAEMFLRLVDRFDWHLPFSARRRILRMEDPISVVDEHMNCIWISQKFLELVKRPSELILGKTSLFMAGPDLNPADHLFIGEKVKGHEPFYMDKLYHFAPQEPKLCRIEAVPVSNIMGQSLHYLLFINEIDLL